MSLQNRLKKAKERNFVGREEQLDIFRKNIIAKTPLDHFLFISGQGGVGKSTLLAQLQSICRRNLIPCALTDYPENTPCAAMNRLATTFEKMGHSLNSFRKRYQKYILLEEKIQRETDKPNTFGQIFSRLAEKSRESDKPDTFGQIFSRFIGKSMALVGHTTPLTSAALELIGTDMVEDQITNFSNYLFQKLGHKDDVQLMLDPTAELSPLFIADLNKISQKRQIVLMFYTFENTQTALLPWLMNMVDKELYGEVSERIKFVFAGRSFNHHDWLPFETLLSHCSLESFTKEETTLYLNNYGITDPVEVNDIHNLSNGLPLHVEMLAASGGKSDGKTTRTVVERFLCNIHDPILRKVAFQTALTRKFDRDVLAYLFSSEIDTQQIDTVFSKLIDLPFVQTHLGHWVYHSVVRTEMIALQRNQSLDQFSEIHKKLAQYYRSRLEQAVRLTQNQWQNQVWWSYYVEATYHSLCANPYEKLAEIKKEIAEIILDVDSKTIFSWVSALRQASTDLDDYEPAMQLAALVEAGK